MSNKTIFCAFVKDLQVVASSLHKAQTTFYLSMSFTLCPEKQDLTFLPTYVYVYFSFQLSTFLSEKDIINFKYFVALKKYFVATKLK